MNIIGFNKFINYIFIRLSINEIIFAFFIFLFLKDHILFAFVMLIIFFAKKKKNIIYRF